jgi:anti-sigma-K factor RskA
MTTHEQVAQDLPLFALGTLTDDDRRSVEEHLRECARCRFELHLLREDMSRLSLVGPEISSPDLIAHEETRIIRELPPMITLDGPAPVPSNRIYWLTALPVLLCVVLGAMVAQLRQQNIEFAQTNAAAQSEIASERSKSEHSRLIDSVLHDSTTTHFAISTAPDKAPLPQMQVMFHPSLRRAVVVASRLPRPEGTKIYQLWLTPISGSQPTSAGIFVPDANGNVFLLSPQLPADLQFSGFQITAENPGGAPAPTGSPIYSGK